MWKSDRWKTVLLNIFLALLIIAILCGLLYFMLQVRHQTREQDEKLSELYVQQQQQQTEARQESLTTIQAEYDKDMETVTQYLPGIVCWGDSLTLGSAGNISFPSVLQTYMNVYFCDIYDFRSTIPNAEDYARLKWDSYKVNVPVVNLGANNESTYTVLGRAGVVPFVLAKPVTIPAEKEPVEITIVSESGKAVTPLVGGNAGVNNVTIGGIEGLLSVTSVGNSKENYRYFFTRSNSGEETEVEQGTEIITSASEEYKDYIHVVCIGTYGGFSDPADLVSQVEELLSRQVKNTDRFIVLGICGNYKQTFAKREMENIDTAMTQAFGSRYINIRKYLTTDGLTDAGITISNADKRFIESGMVPPSFTTSTGSYELNGTAYTLIGRLVYERMESLGYFNEVFEELQIRESTKQILQDDPTYFDRLIKFSLN